MGRCTESPQTIGCSTLSEVMLSSSCCPSLASVLEPLLMTPMGPFTPFPPMVIVTPATDPPLNAIPPKLLPPAPEPAGPPTLSVDIFVMEVLLPPPQSYCLEGERIGMRRSNRDADSREKMSNGHKSNGGSLPRSGCVAAVWAGRCVARTLYRYPPRGRYFLGYAG